MTDEKEIQEPDMTTEAEAMGEETPRDEVREGSGAEESVADESAEESMAAEVDELRSELASLNEQHLRLAAEFDNYRKRNERDRAVLATRLQTDLVKSLLDVLDDLQRVAQADDDARADAVLEGVRLVEKKFIGVLEGAGLEPIEADAAPFDPEVMEALMTVPTDDPERDHHVADVFQRGYRFRDTLVRPARVRVWQYDHSESE